MHFHLRIRLQWQQLSGERVLLDSRRIEAHGRFLASDEASFVNGQVSAWAVEN
jgi:hypothetical protein